MNANALETTAKALVAEGKGILAADESAGSIEKRLASINIPSTEENRRAYREMLITTPGISDFISGVILFDETLRQKKEDGTPLPEVLSRQGIFSGIKVDTGAKPLPRAPGETVTEGLDGLRGRLEEYFALGARFTKWRAVITIGDGIPSKQCIDANADALARYAALSIEAGLVPVVEPEVLMDGDHTIERCYQVSEVTLHSVFHSLFEQHVPFGQILLKPNMMISGKDCPVQAGVQEVAEASVRCYLRHVPAAVPGIVFLSGGQSDEAATAHLNAMNAMDAGHPWQLSFSYGRALQAPALKAWAGSAENVPLAQKILFHRARCNSAARSGSYSEELEKELAAV